MDSPPLAHKPCVLVVDDERSVCETLSEVVEMAGCSVVVAYNGAEALKILEQVHPCLVILDLTMPVMSGPELIEALKAEGRLEELKVLVSTSAPERAPAGIPVARKPIDIHLVWDWIRRSCPGSNCPR